jgi:hypothetical protein
MLQEINRCYLGAKEIPLSMGKIGGKTEKREKKYMKMTRRHWK